MAVGQIINKLGKTMKLVIRLSCLLLLMLGITACKQKSQPKDARENLNTLEHLLEHVEPWRASKDYSKKDWDKLVAAARGIQHLPPEEVERVFNRYIEEHSAAVNADYSEISKPFLALRMAFELPEESRTDPKFNVMLWRSARAEVNSDGSFNAAWPLSFKSGSPRLQTRFAGFLGPTYDIVSEYKAMRAAYPFRKL
jgi:hypothetical protein